MPEAVGPNACHVYVVHMFVLAQFLFLFLDIILPCLVGLLKPLSSKACDISEWMFAMRLFRLTIFLISVALYICYAFLC